METLGQRIRRLRVQAGLSQQQLAGGELTRAFICMIERGRARPSLDSLRLIAGRLHQPVSAFLDLEATATDQDLLQVLLHNAGVLLAAGRTDAATDTLRQAWRLAADRNLVEGQFAALQQLAGVLRGQGAHDEAFDCCERFLDLARARQLPARIVQGYLQLGETAYAMHQFLVARRYYERAVRETDERKSVMDLRQQALISKGNCQMRLGQWAEAAAAYEEAADLHPYLGEEKQLAYAWMGLGAAYRRLGRLEDARRVTLSSLELLQKLGDRNRVLVLQNLATVEGEQGLWQAAMAKFETCREAYRMFGWPASEASLLEELALLHKGAGEVQQSEAYCDEALALLEQQDEPILRGRLLKLQGELRLLQGDAERGRELLRASASILRYFADRELVQSVTQLLDATRGSGAGK